MHWNDFSYGVTAGISFQVLLQFVANRWVARIKRNAAREIERIKEGRNGVAAEG